MSVTLSDEPKIERMIVMAERLIAALEGDIAALKAGKPAGMKSLELEVQKLSALYGREAQNFDIRLAQSARPILRARFVSRKAKERQFPDRVNDWFAGYVGEAIRISRLRPENRAIFDSYAEILRARDS